MLILNKEKGIRLPKVGPGMFFIFLYIYECKEITLKFVTHTLRGNPKFTRS